MIPPQHRFTNSDEDMKMIPDNTTMDCTSCTTDTDLSCSCRSKIEDDEGAFLMETTAPSSPDESSLPPTTSADDVCCWSEIRVHERIGNGSFAMILKATYQNSKVALKCIKEGDLDSNCRQGALDDLRKEAQILTRLSDHPHIVSLKAVGSHEGSPFFLLQLLQEESLDDRIKRWGKQQSKIKNRNRFYVFPKILLGRRRSKNTQVIVVPTLYDRLLNIAFKLSKALNFIHSKQILHCDLKPSNIGFDLEGNVQIFDFGLSEDLSSNDPKELCQSGSYRYMSPEAMEGMPILLSSDIYSFGLTLWELVMLEKPFKNIHQVDPLTDYVVHSKGRPSLDQIQSQQLRDLFKECWHPNPSERITSEKLVKRMMNVLSEDKQQQEEEATSADEAEVPSPKQKLAKKKKVNKKQVVSGEGANLVYQGNTIEVVVKDPEEQRSSSSFSRPSFSSSRRRRGQNNKDTSSIDIIKKKPSSFRSPATRNHQRERTVSTKTLSILSDMMEAGDTGAFGQVR